MQEDRVSVESVSPSTEVSHLVNFYGLNYLLIYLLSFPFTYCDAGRPSLRPEREPAYPSPLRLPRRPCLRQLSKSFDSLLWTELLNDMSIKNFLYIY